MKTSIALLLFIASTTILSFAQAQSVIDPRNQTEVAVEYSYLRANAPPAQCDCFSLNGGSISLAQPFRSGRFAFVFDTTISHGSEIGTGGLRPDPLRIHGRSSLPATASRTLEPVRRSALLARHTPAGSLVEGPTPAASDPALVFASTIGGGLDRRVTRSWSLRIIEADYLLTTSSNRANDHQNSLRISAGAAYHFGKR